MKYKHLLKAELLRLEEVQMAADNYNYHMLPYIVYMALDSGNDWGVWKRKLTLKTQASKKVAIGTLTCEFSLGL